MRRLYPTVDDEQLDDLYLDLELPAGSADRPFVFLGMVSSVDGAASVEGHTAALGSEADRQAYRRLRELADAIFVGAGTVRAEGYGPPPLSPAAVERRRQRGQPPFPRLVVVSGRLALDRDARLFTDPARRPLLITTAEGAAQGQALADVADLWPVGSGRVDLEAALRRLAAAGYRRVLCEGGPTLNGQLVAGGLVDELFLTMTPALVGDPTVRIVQGALPRPSVPLALAELREHGGELLLRYRVGRTCTPR